MDARDIKPISEHAKKCSDLAITAMRTFKCMEVVYQGEERTVEVHAVGWNAEWQYIMQVWQVRGGSRSGQPEGWKFMLLDDVLSFRLSETTSLAPRVSYRAPSQSMRVIDAVEFPIIPSVQIKKTGGGMR